MSSPSNRPFRFVLLALAGTAILSLCLGGGLTPVRAQEDASPAAQGFSNYSDTGPGPSGPTEARTPAENERLYQSLKGLLMSPYCPGLTLGSCGSGAAELLRQDLREWVEAGHTREQIVDYYRATFGEEFLGRPPFRGSAILVWVAPIVAVLLGLTGIVLWLRRAASEKAPTEGTAGPDPVVESKAIDPDTDARLEAEVRARYG